MPDPLLPLVGSHTVDGEIRKAIRYLAPGDPSGDPGESLRIPDSLQNVFRQISRVILSANLVNKCRPGISYLSTLKGQDHFHFAKGTFEGQQGGLCVIPVMQMTVMVGGCDHSSRSL